MSGQVYIALDTNLILSSVETVLLNQGAGVYKIFFHSRCYEVLNRKV